MHVQVIVILSIVTIFTVAEDKAINESCMTPNNETAKCIPYDNCIVIVAALTVNGSAAEDFVRKSQCGYDSNLDQFLVCCGTTAYFKPKSLSPDIFHTLFTKPTTQKPGIVLAEFDTTLLPERSICGQVRETPRIAGGTQANIDEFPWTVALEYINKQSLQNEGVKCGGTLLNEKYVLTAAHCLRNSEFRLTAVRLGEWDISGNPHLKDCLNDQCTDGAQVYNISEAISHSFYSHRNQNDDIGLIRIDGKVEYTDYIRPICLPPSNLPFAAIGSLLTATGWGATGINEKPVTIKQKVQLPLLENEYCNTHLPTKINVDQICAGGQDGKDTCQGDSGGPLMRIYSDSINKERWYLEGIVSKGLQCGKGSPGVYTRVLRYMNWITNILSEELDEK